MSRNLVIRAAFAHVENRIAPVFDTAREFHIVEAESGRIMSETEERLHEDLPVLKSLRLVELGIGTVICGGISRELLGLLSAYGIHVIPFVAGDLPLTIRAWLDGSLEGGKFAMPGYARRGPHRHLHDSADNGARTPASMRRRKGGGHGRGGRSERERRPESRGALPPAIADAGTCLCPTCGHREPHERGVPCVMKRCPQCGSAMTRL